MAKGAPSLSPKGYSVKAAETPENTAKPVENEHRHVFLSTGCVDKDLASEGCMAKEFPLSIHPFRAKEKTAKGYIDKGLP